MGSARGRGGYAAATAGALDAGVVDARGHRVRAAARARPRLAIAPVRQPATALFFAAQSLGCFTAEGIDLEERTFELGRDALASLQQGRVEAAIVYETPVIRAAFTGPRLRVLTALHGDGQPRLRGLVVLAAGARDRAGHAVGPRGHRARGGAGAGGAGGGALGPHDPPVAGIAARGARGGGRGPDRAPHPPSRTTARAPSRSRAGIRRTSSSATSACPA
jgi:hypothetical protein